MLKDLCVLTYSLSLILITTQGLSKGLSLQQYSFGEFRKYPYVGAISCSNPE